MLKTKIIEVVCTGCAADLLGIRLGMKHPRRLVQGRYIVMQLITEVAPNGWDKGNKHRMAVQLDEENPLVDVSFEIEICYGQGVPVILGLGDYLNSATGMGDESSGRLRILPDMSGLISSCDFSRGSRSGSAYTKKKDVRQDGFSGFS